MRVGIFSMTGACIGAHEETPLHMWVGDVPVQHPSYPLAVCSLCRSREQYDEGICVESGHHDTDEMILDRIFRFFNRVDEGDHERMKAVGYMLPSLSVGDLISFNHVTYRVDRIGFTKLTGTAAGTDALFAQQYGGARR